MTTHLQTTRRPKEYDHYLFTSGNPVELVHVRRCAITPEEPCPNVTIERLGTPRPLHFSEEIISSYSRGDLIQEVAIIATPINCLNCPRARVPNPSDII